MAVDVSDWLEQLGLAKYAQAFIENEVDLDAARDLTDEDLKDLGLPLGPRKKLLRAIAQISRIDDQRATTTPSTEVADGPGPRPTEAERRHLTVMFCDLVGSTGLAARLDPEDMHALLTEFQETCGRVATDHGGHVAKLLGDGILIYFGYPKAKEDDAERSVRAAIAITDAVKRIDAGAQTMLQSRIGIASGVVVIGDILSGGGADLAAVSGSVPHLAARLESAAAPNSVVIASSTRQLVGELFDLEQCDPIHLKGFDEPVRAFAVRGTAEIESRFAATRNLGGRTFVGRENELGMLRDSWNAATESEGQAVLVSGEAGIGKSRLVAEFCNWVSSKTHIRLRYQCSPQHTDAPLYPVADQLRRAAKIDTNDSADQQARKLKDLLREAVPNVDDMASLFSELVGIRATGSLAPANHSPERFKELIFEATAIQLEGLSKKQPVLVVFEDLHWADLLTNELLAMIVSRGRRWPVMVLATTRPEHQPNWLELAQATHLNLNRIRRRGAVEIAESAAGMSLPASILDEILEKADGNPLFIEEITKSLIDSGLADSSDRDGLSPASTAIPATLHDSLVGRLDKLAAEKDVAQLASVIGRSFRLDMLAHASDRPVEVVRDALSNLAEAGIIYRLPGSVGEAYEFKHALIRDAAYDSLTRSSRANYHQVIGECLEKHFSHIAETDPALVAHHFIAAQVPSKSLKYLLSAGKIAQSRTALEDAARHFRTGLEIIGNLPSDSKKDDDEIAFQLALGSTLISIDGYGADSAFLAYDRAYDLSRSAQGNSLREQIMSGLCTILLNRADLDRVESLLRKRLELGHKSGDDAALCASYRLQCTLNEVQGRFEKSEPFARLSIEHFNRLSGKPTDYQLPHQIGVGAHAHMAVPLLHLGKLREAQLHVEKAVTLARASDHPNTVGYAIWWAALSSFLRRDRIEFVQRTRELGEIGSKYGIKQWFLASECFSAWGTTVGLDAADDVLASALKASEELEERKVLFFRGFVASVRVQALLDYGRTTEALQEAEANLELSSQRGLVWFNSELLRLRGEAALSMNSARKADLAIKSFEAAHSLAQEQGSKLFQLRSAVNLANEIEDPMLRTATRDRVASILSEFDGDDTWWDIRRARSCIAEVAPRN